MYVLTTSIILIKTDVTSEQILPASYSNAVCRGYLGRGNRKVISSCDVLEVGHWYPSPSEVYMGFKEY